MSEKRKKVMIYNRTHMYMCGEKIKRMCVCVCAERKLIPVKEKKKKKKKKNDEKH